MGNMGNMGTISMNNNILGNIGLGNSGHNFGNSNPNVSQNPPISSNFIGGLDFGSNSLNSLTTTSNSTGSSNLNIIAFSDNNLEITFNCSKVLTY